MDVLGRHRAAFNNTCVQLFADLERDLEPALEKGVEEKAGLEKVINDQKRLLKEQEQLLGGYEKAKIEQVEVIAEKKKEIAQLKYELAKAVVENESLEELLAPEAKSNRRHKRTVLGTPPRKLLQDKENIAPFSATFNYLAPTPPKLPTLERPISPPTKSPIKSTIPPNPFDDRGMQTERPHENDEAVQTGPISAPKNLAEAYYELATRYDALRNDMSRYKSAHQELQEKYLKNKKVWEAWIKIDKERLEQAKKRKRDGSVVSGGGERHGYTTPTRSIAGRTPYTRPPTLSPNKPMYTPEVSDTLSKKVGLFAGFAASMEKTGIVDDLGVDIGTSKGSRDVPIESTAAAAPMGNSCSEPGGSDDISLPSLVSEPKAPSITRRNPKNATTPGSQDHIDSSTDSESSELRDSDATPTQKLYDHPPIAPPRSDSLFKILKTKKGKWGNQKCAREGDTMLSPVLIKSEPSAASSEGFGYNVYEQESLDLDDIGYKPNTPRKKQRNSGSLVEEPTSSVGSSGRPGWNNGGFTIKRAPGVVETQDPVTIEDTQDEDEGIMWNNDETSVPVLPSLAMYFEGPGGNTANYQLPGTGHNKKEDNDSEMRSSPPLIEDQLVSHANQSPSPTPIRRALPTVEEPVSRKEAPDKPRTERRVASRYFIAQITEDGTDGTEDVDAGDFYPLMTSEKQGKKLEGVPKLNEILNSPAPKTPSLAHLRGKMGTSKSVPPKKPLEKETKALGSVSEPPKRKGWIGPMRHIKGNQKGHRQSKLDISHFRVNPNANDGRDYAFAETVRNREARKCLPGCTKSCCRELVGFVEAAGLPSPAPRGPRWRSSSPPTSSGAAREQEVEMALDKKFTTKFGKHRDAFTRQKSPPGFWDASFPDTQDLQRQHEVAEMVRLQKIEEMRREAEKGGKGRYIYKD